MPIVFVQQSSTFTTTSATIPSGADGNTLVLTIATLSTSPATVVSLTCTNVTWTKLSGTVSGQLAHEIWFGQISGGASGTTVTIVLASIGAIIAGSTAEFSGVMATGVVINSGPNTNNGNSMTSATGDFVTTVDANLIIVSTAYGDSVAPGAQPGGYTALNFDSNITVGAQTNYTTTNTAGTQSVTWGLATPQDWVANAGALRKPVTVSNINGGPGNFVTDPFVLTQDQESWYGFAAYTGVPPYTASATGLPAGMTLLTTPEFQETSDPAQCAFKVTGAPTTPGTYTPIFTVTDSLGGTGVWNPTVQLPNAGWLVISTQGNGTGQTFASLPPASKGVAYNFAFDSTYADAVLFNHSPSQPPDPPYTYVLFATPWPGLSLSSTGVLSGTPTQASYPSIAIPFHFSGAIRITNNSGVTEDGVIWFHVYGFQTGCPFVNGTVGDAYSEPISQTPPLGGTPPYTYSIVVGALPPGLTLDSATGIISGTPTLDAVSYPHTYTYTWRLTDDVGATQDTECGTTIFGVAELTLGCGDPPNGVVNEAYGPHTFPATGGTEPYTFSIIAGALPPGLALNASTGEVTGIPTTPGVYGFTVQVEDADAHTVSIACSIAINASPIQYRNTGASGRGYRCTTGQIPMCLPPNELDVCLKATSNTFNKYIKSGSVWKRSYPKYAGMKSPPWVTSPFDAIRLNRNASVLFSDLTANVLTPVLTYTVPAGFCGVVNQLLQIFAPTSGGTGFQDGSTQLEWYLGVNECFVAAGFMGMNYHQGSLNSIGRVAQGAGIRLYPNQIYTYFVVSDGTALDANGKVICGLNGWIYPIHG